LFVTISKLVLSSDLQNLQSEPTCYEPLEDEFRENAKFWVEGIAILVVGICGLIGNLLSIFVLRRSRGNKGFHTLLIM
jgi:hypothetical protein